MIQKVFCWNWTNYSQKLNTAGNKVINQKLIHLMSGEGRPKLSVRYWLKEPSADTEQIIARSKILTESKPPVKQQDSAMFLLIVSRSLLQMFIVKLGQRMLKICLWFIFVHWSFLCICTFYTSSYHELFELRFET